MTFLRFLAAIWPDLRDFAKLLYQLHDGNADKAKGHIRRIKNHGMRLDDARERIDAELEQLKPKD